ncbi:MAG: acyltransferase family protein [Actinomycetes bacterium]
MTDTPTPHRPPAAAPTARHIRALDGVRGAAVIAVLLFHGGMLRGGYLGVDLFFVLSGFLITSLLLAEGTSTGRIALGPFWARRARRLLPALFLMLAVVAIYAAFIAEPNELARIRGDFLATLGYVANWRFVLGGFDYWTLFTSPSPLAHTWSLAIEEQFYVFWPLIVVGLGLLVGRRAGEWARTVLVVCGVLVAASAALALWFWFTSEATVRIYYGTDTRAAAILMGAALAAWLIWRGPVRRDGARLALEATAVVALAVLAVCWWRLEGQGLYAGGLLLCGVCATAVIAAAAHPNPGPVARAFSWRPLVGAGLVSYGLYLWHWPVYVLLDPRRTGLDGWPLLALRISVTTAIALASYHLVEQPIRQRRWSTGTLRWLTPVSAAVLVALAFGSTMRAAPDRRIARVDASSARAAAARAAQREGTTRLMVVGNSIGWFLGDEGFKPRDAEAATTTLNAAFPACHFPTVDLERGAELGAGHAAVDCTVHWDRAVREFRPDTVLFLLGDAGSIAGNRGAGWFTPCDPTYRRWTRDGLEEARATLTGTGARLVVTTAPISLSSYAVGAIDQSECQNATIRRYAAADPGVGLVDLERFICRRGPTRCLTRMDGVLLRPDGLHYRDESARLVARWLTRELGRIGALGPIEPAGASGATGAAGPTGR